MHEGERIRLFRKKLLAWFRIAGRDLPWRKTSDPYRVLISEVMLQQTQVDRVIPKYLAFLKRFPDWQKLARAAQSSVVKMWSGLGYNRRAIALHQLAKRVVMTGDGELPRDHDALVSLPGIGAYTAEAVRAFAFRTKGAAPVDTNIDRVLRRVFGKRGGTVQAIRSLAARTVAQDVWSYNHAIMDFGASICTARSPRCEGCPMKNICGSYPCAGEDIRKPKQKKFEGSDRMYRGSVLKLLKKNNVLRRTTFAKEIGLPEDVSRAEQILSGLIRDGFVEVKRGTISLVA